MLILGLFGFSYTQNRLKIGELIQNQSCSILIIPLASMFGIETVEKEKNCASMLDFKTESIFVFDDAKPDFFLEKNYDLYPHTQELSSAVIITTASNPLKG